MFSPTVIAAREAALIDQFGEALPGGTLTRYPLDICWGMRDQLTDAVDEKGTPTRALTPDEQAFITNEQLVSTLDYRYWSERYAIVNKEAQDTAPLTPRWASQELFLARVAAIEESRFTAGHPDGILVNVLKARQLGISTETEVLLAHRVTTQTGLRSLIAADAPEQSEYLFQMAELVIENLPWWLKPATRFHQAAKFWAFDTGSYLRAHAGKSQRGALQDRGGVKGNIGRGRTYSGAHLSELSTWERPEQLDDGFFPAVPMSPRTFVVCESTAKGRHNWWHDHWLTAERASGRFTNVFIPWYIEPEKYWLPAPLAWTPSPVALAHAAAVERDSPQWCLGVTIRLTREQLYWYDSTRQTFDEKGRLSAFLEEYPATPEEAFQHTGRSVFSLTTQQRLATQERPPVAVLLVEPAKDIAQLREWERQHGSPA